MYVTQPVEEVNLDQPAREWEEIETIGHQLKMQNDSGSSITLIATE